MGTKYRIDKNARCAVVGYGSWATALVKVLLENEQRVGWYIRRADVIGHISRKGHNPRYIPGAQLDTSRLDMSDDINKVVSEADIVILAVPSAFLQMTLEPLTVSLEEKFVVSAIKGIIPEGYVTIAEYVNEHYGLPYDQIGIIAGPSHSEEVSQERLSYLTLVCKSTENATVLCDKFTTPYIITNPSTDIYGTEYAAVLKNIYAICAGIAVGLGYGDNFLAVLISNAAIEMNRFLNESYPSERNTSASAYLGDLLVTAYSKFSRNREFGMMIGRGYSVPQAQEEMDMVAEGYYAAECIMQVNKRFGISMPIAECVYGILYGGLPAGEEIRKMTKKLI